MPMKRAYVEHLAFRGLTFEYTNFELPPGNSNDSQGSASVPAAIRLSGARNCAFEHCTVRNLGTFAFEIDGGLRGQSLSGTTRFTTSRRADSA